MRFIAVQSSAWPSRRQYSRRSISIIPPPGHNQAMNTRIHTLLLPFAFATARLFAAPVANGGFEDNPSVPAFISPWQASGAVTPTRDSSDVSSGLYSLRVTGRAAATDGVAQPLNVATAFSNGASYLTRFRIKVDAPAQVRCLLYINSSVAQPPLILAEAVFRAGQVGQWLTVEGSQQISWGGTVVAARLYFAVEQMYPGTAPASAFPSFRLDDVTIEPDDDRDGLSNTEETTGGTLPGNADSDSDRMNDRWELNHGLNPNDPLDAPRDDDFDGESNLVEYWANTDPHDASSYPGIPSDPLASPATRALLYNLQTRGARSTGRYLTGQQAMAIRDGDYTNYVVGLNTLMTAAGHPSWVSVLGLAAEGPTAAQPMQIDESGPVGRDFMDAGGLVVLHWSPRNPWTNNFNGDHTGLDIPDLLTPGTAANLRMIGWMDTLADELALFGPDRPVIFRPFSEMNGAWNWYGHLRQDEYIDLYRWLRDYFVNTRGLHNIIWTLESHIGAHRAGSLTNPGVSMDYYWPGDGAIDLIGFSAYIHNWDPTFDADTISRLHPKAFAITEGGPPSNEDDVPNAYNSLYLDALDAYYPRAAFFVIWNSFPTGPNIAIKDNPDYIGLLTDARATNREGLFWRAPALLAAASISSSQFGLSWTGLAGATGYALEASATGLAPWSPAGAGVATNETVGGYAPSTLQSFRVRAVYPGGVSAALALASATTWSGYQQWKNDELGNRNAPDLADDDLDGLPSLLEYAVGGRPATDSSALKPYARTESAAGQDYLTLIFRRRLDADGIDYNVECAGDLMTDEWLPDPVPVGSPVDNGDGTDTVTYRDIIPIHLAPARYLRLRIGTQ